MLTRSENTNVSPLITSALVGSIGSSLEVIKCKLKLEFRFTFQSYYPEN